MRIVRLVSSLLALLPLICAAQTSAPGAAPEQEPTESLARAQLKGRVPVNPQTLRVQLPRAQEAVLSNGLRVFLLEDHELPTFSVQLVIKGGGLADPPERRGVAMVTAALLREGTKQRTSREIAEQLATLGVSFNASASPSSGESFVGLSGLSENMDAALAIAADVILNPTFPAAELDKFKARFASQVQYQRSLPSFLAQERFMSAVYGDHPGGIIVPSDDVIAALTPEHLAAYHASVYRPNNTFVLAHGDVSLKELVGKLEAAFGGWAKGEPVAIEQRKVAAPSKARAFIIDRPGSVQTTLRVGSLGIERTSEDYFALLVTNYILGGGPASRLFANLREDKGYTYGVSSGFSGSTFPGIVITSTDVRTEVTEGAIRELVKELRRLAEEPVSQEDLKNAQRALIGRFALSLDSPQTLLSNLATQKIYGFPDDYWDTYPKHVEAITPKDILRVAKKYYDPERLQIVAVGDAKSVRPILEKYASIEEPKGAE